jgi:hypothetical protein
MARAQLLTVRAARRLGDATRAQAEAREALTLLEAAAQTVRDTRFRAVWAETLVENGRASESARVAEALAALGYRHPLFASVRARVAAALR